MKPRNLLAGLFLVLALFPSASLEIAGLEGHMGMIWYGNSERLYTPSPLKGSLGAALILSGGTSRLEFRPELEMFFLDYVWDDASGRAVPAAVETADRISVLHLLASPAFVSRHPLDEEGKLSWGWLVSPSVLLRVPLLARDSGGDTMGDVALYLYSAGRFFYPTGGAFFQWKFREKLVFSVEVKASLPIFNLWDGRGLGFYDQMIVNGTAGFRIPL